MARPKILICDDEEGVREALKLVLDSRYDLTIAEDGEEAVTRISEAAYDILILDIKMPRMDGIEALKRIRQLAPSMPILILTAEASYHAPYDHCTVKYLEQAGVRPEWIKLADVGIHGNGHMMMLEKNNVDIGAVMSKWLDKALR